MAARSGTSRRDRMATTEIRVVSLGGGAMRRLDSVRLVGLNHPFAVFKDGQRLVAGNEDYVSDEIWVIQPQR